MKITLGQDHPLDLEALTAGQMETDSTWPALETYRLAGFAFQPHAAGCRALGFIEHPAQVIPVGAPR
jgi:hypothetical protein